MGSGTVHLPCFAGIDLILFSGDRGIHHPNNSLIQYLDSPRSDTLGYINRYRFLTARSSARIP